METPRSASRNPGDTPPRAGAERARDRLLAAARELLAEVPMNTITVRMIAARAGVGHSLITRHYGSRARLLITAIGVTLIAFADDIARAPDVHTAVRGAFNRVRENPELTAAITVATMETDTVEKTESFPIVDAFAAQLEAAGATAERARERATTITLMIFTWASAEARWLKMSGHNDDPTTGRYQYLQTLLELVDNAVGARPTQATAASPPG